MIETYKIVSGKYQPDVAPTLYKSSFHVTRGKYDLRKFSFSNRVVNIWNSLPNRVVSANTTNTFKARLGKFWRNIIYSFKAQLQGTRSPSECLL